MQFLKTTLLLFLGFSILSCNKDDETSNDGTAIKPYAEQATIDDLAITKFLEEYHLDVTADFEDVAFTKITENSGLKSIKSDYLVKTKIVKIEGVEHKAYYISFREGVVDKAPTRVDSVLVNYQGFLLNNKPLYDINKTFNQNQFFGGHTGTPTWLGSVNNPSTLRTSILGWQEIFPLFKPGQSNVLGDNSLVFSDFGAGVMFIPSALGYYHDPRPNIPSYSPLIFHFTLKGVNYVDNDLDAIDSRFEDLDGDGEFADDDTDGDRFPNYLDQDDDNDGVLTKDEKIGDDDNDGIPNYLDKDSKARK